MGAGTSYPVITAAQISNATAAGRSILTTLATPGSEAFISIDDGLSVFTEAVGATQTIGGVSVTEISISKGVVVGGSGT
jgi:hypothetical protein